MLFLKKMVFCNHPISEANEQIPSSFFLGNFSVTMTDMGRLGWSDPKKAGPMLSKIPLGRFAGN